MKLIIFLVLITAGSAIAQPPVIDSMLINESKGILSVFGDFGAAQGKVWCDSVELPVVSWSASLITATIPDTGRGSAGGVVVGARSYQSKERMLTKWEGNKSTQHSEHSPSGQYTYSSGNSFHFVLRMDLQSLLKAKATWNRIFLPQYTTSYEVDESCTGAFCLYDGSEHQQYTMRAGGTVLVQNESAIYNSGFSCEVTFSPINKTFSFNVTNIRGFSKTTDYNTQNGHVHKTEDYPIGDITITIGLDSQYHIIENSYFAHDQNYDHTDGHGISGSQFALPSKTIALQFNPSIIAPINGGTNLGTNNLALRWDTLKLMDNYHLQVSKDSIVNRADGGKHPPQANTFIVDTTISSIDFTLFPLEKNTKYYWRVAGRNSEGESRWSDVWNFTTGANAAVGSDAASSLNLSIYPNPSVRESAITYTLSERGEVRLVVYDMTGRLAATLFDGIAEKGSHESVFDASKLGAGSYIIGLISGTNPVSKVVRVVK